jgi:hypothetical protein
MNENLIVKDIVKKPVKLPLLKDEEATCNAKPD